MLLLLLSVMVMVLLLLMVMMAAMARKLLPQPASRSRETAALQPMHPAGDGERTAAAAPRISLHRPTATAALLLPLAALTSVRMRDANACGGGGAAAQRASRGSSEVVSSLMRALDAHDTRHVTRVTDLQSCSAAEVSRAGVRWVDGQSSSCATGGDNA